jgi:hypothetical protein
MVPAFLGCTKKYRRDILHNVKTDMVIIEAVSEIEMTVSFQVQRKREPLQLTQSSFAIDLSSSHLSLE